MKKLLFAVLIIAVAFTAYAAKPELPIDGRGQKIQGFAPDGKKTVFLTVNSLTTDTSNDTSWEVYTPTACKYRLMSTVTKAGTALTSPANARLQRNVNASTRFVNWTGCASGEWLRQ